MFSDHIQAPIDPLYNFDFKSASVLGTYIIVRCPYILIINYVTIVLSPLIDL